MLCYKCNWTLLALSTERTQIAMVQRESGPRPNVLILIFILVSFVLVAGLLFFLYSISKTTSSDSGGPVPYNVNSRLLPTTTNIRELFPQTLGAFTRKAVNGDLSGSDATRFGASYASGKDTITINGIRESSTNQMMNDFSQLLPKVVGTDRSTNTQRSFAYVIATTNGGTVRFVYARGFWLFDLAASSRAALDEFMKVFQY